LSATKILSNPTCGQLADFCRSVSYKRGTHWVVSLVLEWLDIHEDDRHRCLAAELDEVIPHLANLIRNDEPTDVIRSLTENAS